MWQIMMNLFGNGNVTTVYQEYVCIATAVLLTVLILWLFDLVVQLFKNFWK